MNKKKILNLFNVNRLCCLSIERALYLFCITLILFSYQTNAQSKKEAAVLIKWQSTTGSKSPVLLKIYRQKNLIYFDQASNENQYMIKLNILSNDTLTIFISSGDSISGKKSIIPSADRLNIVDILIERSAEQLEEIHITPSGHYKRGDTTIFFSDYYKQKEDLALKDLLQRIPNIKILDNGGITYKGKRVSLIKIQGEELFSDQQQLLANHIPVHILNSVEIIENASSHKILKGLRKNGEVYINLTLRDKYKNKIWGSLLSGLGRGNGTMYQVNPVLFSLKAKLKLGFISSMSSTGITVNKTELLQIKTPNLLALIPVTGQSPDILVPFENSARYFNRNKMEDHRLQITGQVSKNGKISFESRYLKEHTIQQSSVFTARLTDSLFNKQTLVSSKKWHPSFFYTKSGYTVEKERLLLTISVLWQKFTDVPNEFNKLTEQGSSLLYEQNQFQQYETRKAEINLTKRISSTQAKKLVLAIENTGFLRNGMYRFSDGASLLTLSSDNPLSLNQIYNLQLTSFHSTFERVASSGKVSRPFKWDFEWKVLRMNCLLNALQDSGNLQPLRIEEYSSADYFNSGNIGAEKSFEKKITKGFQKTKGRVALGMFMSKDRAMHSRISLIPMLNIQHEVEKNLTKAGTLQLHLQYSEGSTDVLKLNQNPYPLQGLNYSVFTKPVFQERTLYINTSLYGKMGKKILPQGEFSTSLRFFSPLFIISVKGPLSITRIRMIAKPGVNVQIGGHLQLIAGKKIPFIKASIKSGFQEFYFLTGSRITKFRNGFFQSEINAEWHPVKFLHIRIYTQFDLRYNLTQQLLISKEESKNLQYRQEIKIIYHIAKQVQVEFAGMQIRNNAVNKGWLSQIFSEASFRWKANQHISLHMEAFNLFNLSSFSLIDQNLGYLQSRLNLPIVPRQFILGFRWFF